MDSNVTLAASLVALAGLSGVAGASTACGMNMILSMSHLPKSQSALRIATLYLAGSLLGASLVGSLLGGLGLAVDSIGVVSAFTPPAELILAAAAVLLGLREIGMVPLRLPQRESQLNFEATRRVQVGPRMFAFGFWLGAGFFTFSPYGGLHMIAIAAILSGFPLATLLFVTYGLARALTVVVLGLSTRTSSQADVASDQVGRLYTVGHSSSAAVLFLVAVAALLPAVGQWTG